jgi:hypothetical protein
MASNGQAAMTGGVAAGRPQPQTTVEPAGGPFIRHSQQGRRTQYNVTSVALGGLVANPLVAAPGYTRGYRVKIIASGGTGTATLATVNDTPGSICSLVQLKDSFGTPLIVGPGYETLQLLQLYGGQFGLGNLANVINLPTSSPTSTATGTAGNFTLSTYLPLEFVKAYGVISSANASLLPTLQFNVAASGSFFVSAPSLLPTLQFIVDQDFYWLPEGVSIEPPGLGSTQQWIYQPANPTVGSAATTTVQLPRLGGYLSVIIGDLRDTNGYRVDAWPSAGNRLRFIVDGVPILDTDITTLYDDMAIQMGIGTGFNNNATTNSNTRPSGTIAISRKQSLSQSSHGLFDTGESFLSTNPGTQVEFSAAPWGSVATAPATLNALCGQVVPSGALIQGLPEV